MWENIKRIDDDNVAKFIFEKDDILVESVLYRYPTHEERTVLCISTMCGCPMGCRFCGAGDYFVRSLTTQEIIGQAKYILENEIEGINPNDIKKLQIMFMSMGECALNKALSPAIYQLNGFYPNAALLISSSGPKIDYSWIREVSGYIPQVGLQFSVHESTDAARDKLIPFKNKLTLKEIAHEGELWYNITGRKPFFNYCAHEKNASDADVDRLLSLFDAKIWEATVSVICEREQGFNKSNDRQRNLATGFASLLVEAGYNVRVFDPAGQDTVGGGCGQLIHYQNWVQNNPKAIPSCGMKYEKVHAPMLKG